MPHEGDLLASKDGYNIIDCDHCGFAHVWPLPPEVQIRDLYQNEYFAKIQLPADPEEVQWLSRIINTRLELIEAQATPAAKRMLDIGSGAGLLAMAAQKKGWDVLALEPNHVATKHLQEHGIKVENALFEDAIADRLAAQPFDAVHASYVLEHVLDARAFIQRTKRLLQPGGVLALVVPNDFNPVQMAHQQQTGAPRWWVRPDHHINYFTFESLPALLRSEGFTVDVVTAEAFPIDFFLLMGLDYAQEPPLGKQCQAYRRRLEAAFANSDQEAVRRALCQKLAEINLGREILTIARLGRGVGE